MDPTTSSPRLGWRRAFLCWPLLSVGLGLGCAHPPAQVGSAAGGDGLPNHGLRAQETVARQEAPCRQVNPAVFVIKGPTDRALAECVTANFADTTTELILTSQGGDVAAALDVAERMEAARMVVRVRGECNSSCANYILPLAQTLIVEPDSIIMLHGSIDPRHVRRLEADRARIIQQSVDKGLLRADAVAEYEELLRHTTALVQRQRVFSERHHVSPGWLIYRENDRTWFGRHLKGRYARGVLPRGFGYRYLIVDAPMLASCLPRVRVRPFHLRRLGLYPLYFRGAVSSSTMECTSGSESPSTRERASSG